MGEHCTHAFPNNVGIHRIITQAIGERYGQCEPGRASYALFCAFLSKRRYFSGFLGNTHVPTHPPTGLANANARSIQPAGGVSRYKHINVDSECSRCYSWSVSGFSVFGVCPIPAGCNPRTILPYRVQANVWNLLSRYVIMTSVRYDPEHRTTSKLKGELTHELSQLWCSPGRERQIL